MLKFLYTGTIDYSLTDCMYHPFYIDVHTMDFHFQLPDLGKAATQALDADDLTIEPNMHYELEMLREDPYAAEMRERTPRPSPACHLTQYYCAVTHPSASNPRASSQFGYSCPSMKYSRRRSMSSLRFSNAAACRLPISVSHAYWTSLPSLPKSHIDSVHQLLFKIWNPVDLLEFLYFSSLQSSERFCILLYHYVANFDARFAKLVEELPKRDDKLLRVFHLQFDFFVVLQCGSGGFGKSWNPIPQTSMVNFHVEGQVGVGCEGVVDTPSVEKFQHCHGSNVAGAV